jgi:hypothetical protein
MPSSRAVRRSRSRQLKRCRQRHVRVLAKSTIPCNTAKRQLVALSTLLVGRFEIKLLKGTGGPGKGSRLFRWQGPRMRARGWAMLYRVNIKYSIRLGLGFVNGDSKVKLPVTE